MNILFVASEGVPFVKTGGLADVTGTLPKALKELGIDVRVILPKYKAIPSHFKNKMYIRKRLTIHLGWRYLFLGIEEIKHDNIHYYFIDNEYYFNRDNVYGYGDSFDEAERFAYFSKAVLEALPYLNFKPDILHLHDWQTGLVSLFLTAVYKHKEFYQSIKTVFTIHNLKYQGLFPREIIGDIFDIDQSYFNTEGIEYHGRVSFIKAGLVFSDYITSVSETYAGEIQYPFYGFGLDGILSRRKDDLFGILNGIDTNEYNPETDKNLFVNFVDQDAKLQNKLLLQDMLKLPANKTTPVLAMITRLVPQKGIDLVVRVLEEILSEDIQFIVLGTGDWNYENAFKEAAYRHSDKMSVHLTFDEGLSRKIYAASDLFLMPSLFEPCGISQLIALRYLSVPIVRETGGLKDSVQPYNEFTGEGNGFSFSNYNAHDMLYTVGRALMFYRKQNDWNKILDNIKQGDYSWNNSAKKYLDLYQLLLRKEGDVLNVY